MFIKLSKKTLFAIVSLSFIVTSSIAHKGEIIYPFIQNKGQVNKEVSFYSLNPKANIFISKSGETTYEFKAKESSFVVKETLINSNRPQFLGQNKTKTQINYLLGKSNKHINVPNFNKVNFGTVWKGIDMYVESRPGNAEKIFKLAPGADHSLIQLNINGTEKIKVNSNGELEIFTKGNDKFAFTKPIAWQNTKAGRKEVSVSYSINNLNYGFDLGTYDKSLAVYIDPLLSSTYIGGNGLDALGGMRVDENDNIIIAGMTQSTNFPTTMGLFSESTHGSTDFFVMTLNPEMCEILSATYIGGSGSDEVTAVDFDKDGNIYFVGRSTSTDNPLPDFAYTPFQGSADANGSIYVLKVSADFTSILGTTFLGGDIVDQPRGIKVSDSGNVYVYGFTNSNNYPYTLGAFENSGKGAIISALNSDLTQLVYSTRVGGGQFLDMEFDADGSVYAIGTKFSIHDYTTTAGVYSETPIGGLEGDIYIAHLSEDLSTLQHATFIGSNGIDNPHDIELHGTEIVASTYVKSGFPLTEDPFDDSLLLGGANAIFKMPKDLSTLNASTFIDMTDSNIIVEENGDVVAFGRTSSFDFPGGKNPSEFQYNGGSSDFGLVRLSSDMKQAKNAAYIGGADQEIHTLDAAKDQSGNLIILGTTKSNDIETTQFAFDRNYNGLVDIILQKIPSNFNQQEVISDLIFCDSFEAPGSCSCD